MAVEQALTTFLCDGPGCNEKVAKADPLAPPQGWLRIWGPSDNLGEFMFHSGACYDAWREVGQEAPA